MANSGVVFKWIKSNRTEIKKHRMGIGKAPKMQAHINKMHLDYIATRPGAVFNKNSHGIFGYICNPEENKLLDCDEIDLDMISERVGEITQKGIDVFKTVISLREEDAIRYGYTSRKAWKGLLELKVNEIAKAYKIQASDLEWTASYHSERGHLHCHLLFWDRRQYDENKNNKRVPFVNYEKIRKSLAKEIFKEDYQKLLLQKNEDKNQLFEESSDEISELLAEIFPHKFPNYMFSNKFKQKNFEKMIQMINSLENLIKEENLKALGKEKIDYRYGYQQKNVREYIDEVSMLILNTSSDCKILYDNYIKSYLEIQKLLGAVKSEKDEENVKNIAKGEIMNKMGNCILKTLKQIRIDEEREKKNEEWEKRKEEYEMQRLQNTLNWNKRCEFYTRSTIENIFYELSNLSISTNAQSRRLRKSYSELSKAEKREIAIMKANSDGFDWFVE